MRNINVNEMAVVVGGDDDGNQIACQTAVGAGVGIATAIGGSAAAGVTGAIVPSATALCQAVTTSAGQAIASGIADAGEVVGNFTDTLTQSYGALQMAAGWAHVNWFEVDGL